MSVTYWERQHASGGQTNWDASYEARFIVRTDSKNDGPWTVRAFAKTQVPPYAAWTWANGETDLSARAQEYSEELLKADASRKVWLVRIKYKPVPPGEDPDQQNPDPLQRPWKASGSFVRFQKPAYKDRNDKPLLNSVEQPLKIMRNDSNYQLVLEGYTPTVDVSLADSCVNAVNAQPLWGKAKRHIRLDQWRHATHYENGILCVQHTLEFTIGREPFNERPADVGTRVCTNNGAVIANPATAPMYSYSPSTSGDNRLGQVALNGGVVHPATGRRIAGVEVAVPNPPFIHDFEVADEVDFAALIGLPDPLPYPFV